MYSNPEKLKVNLTGELPGWTPEGWEEAEAGHFNPEQERFMGAMMGQTLARMATLQERQLKRVLDYSRHRRKNKFTEWAIILACLTVPAFALWAVLHAGRLVPSPAIGISQDGVTRAEFQQLMKTLAARPQPAPAAAQNPADDAGTARLEALIKAMDSRLNRLNRPQNAPARPVRAVSKPKRKKKAPARAVISAAAPQKPFIDSGDKAEPEKTPQNGLQGLLRHRPERRKPLLRRNYRQGL